MRQILRDVHRLSDKVMTWTATWCPVPSISAANRLH